MNRETETISGFAVNLKAFLLVAAAILAVKMLPVVPWWTFVVPVLLMGAIFIRLNWKIAYFTVGFLAGFCIWMGGNILFHQIYGGTMLEKFGPLLKVALLFASGLMGGLLSGLALYAGKELLFDKRKEYKL